MPTASAVTSWLSLARWFAPASIAVAAGLAGCTGLGRLSEDPPPGVSFAGNWQLDPHASTDSRQALKQIVPPPSRKRRPPSDEGDYPGGSGGDSGGSQGPGGQGPGGQGPGGQGPGGGRGGARYTQSGDNPNNIPIDISLQQSLLTGGDYLKIEQRANELVISNGETTRSFVPGELSVVSVPTGVADQSSGWKGKEYWIEIKPQVGPRATEKLRLSDKGDQLTETIDVASEGRVHKLHVVRVYTPTREVPIIVPGEN